MEGFFSNQDRCFCYFHEWWSEWYVLNLVVCGPQVVLCYPNVMNSYFCSSTLSFTNFGPPIHPSDVWGDFSRFRNFQTGFRLQNKFFFNKEKKIAKHILYSFTYKRKKKKSLLVQKSLTLKKKKNHSLKTKLREQQKKWTCACSAIFSFHEIYIKSYYY